MSSVIDPNIQIRARAELEAWKYYSRDFKTFVSKADPRYEWYKHCEVLGHVLDRVASGEIKRLMVFMPPRHGKSEAVSRLFSAYWLYKFPGSQVGLASYGADLAHGLSYEAQNYYRATGRHITEDVAAKREWRTQDGSTMWAAGVGGPITGKGFHLGIIDDPVKGVEDAESESFRRAQIDWWLTTWSTRREPNAVEVVIQTRWHVDDLGGWLLQNIPGWHVVVFEAIKTDGHFEFPSSCKIEPDWRVVGDALCPERYPIEALEAIREEQRVQHGSRHWSALYQQRPVLESGNIWKREWFKHFKLGTEPVLEDVGSDWDLAYTDKDDNSASAFVKSGRDKDGNVYVLDLGFRYHEFPELINWMKSQNVPHFIEAKASGKSAKQSLTRDGIYAKEVTVQGGDKIARTRLASPMAESGKVYVASHLVDLLLDDPKQGILKAGGGMESDLNDAFVQAVNRHRKSSLSVFFEA